MDIIVCGIGGQGIITLGKIILNAALKEGLEATMAEYRGHAKRFDSTSCHIRIGSKLSPVIPKGGASLMIALNSFEALRHGEMLMNQGTMIIEKNSVENNSLLISEEEAPNLDGVSTQITGKNIVELDFENLTKQVVELQDKNIFFLGAVSKLNDFPVSEKNLRESIIELIPKRVESSLSAFDVGANKGF
ncbi:MAG: hypothetical protein CL944_01955 [Candidatus Diapherotrites archaeon]|uniref:Pyruvate/ketoisovalerate oxidoreductase catalytic domain-containing protein n=1 Tax=Candidatus Iainarchaeum sp. TaxID=3101447 RepID=A0A2D6LQ30_9ARCH|nr:hypothetical protein [Candidatus Diapherotrites archaeon]|tara:strand:+ start:8801 stop:9370 length:570 start_codon:yes stop_codon:yes gene_type:complete